jgi:hypothetical protein
VVSAQNRTTPLTMNAVMVVNAPMGQDVILTKSKCANCRGEHASWMGSCPRVTAALETHTQKAEYSTGHYEANILFTSMLPQPQSNQSINQLLTSSADSIHLNVIPAMSPSNIWHTNN